MNNEDQKTSTEPEETKTNAKVAESEPKATMPSPLTNNSPSKKPNMMLIIALVVVLLVAGVTTWLTMNQPAPQSADNTPNPQPSDVTEPAKLSRIVAYTSGLSVKAYDPAANEFIDIYKPTEAEKDKLCGPEGGCPARTIALSPDYSKIALDLLLKDDKQSVGYYDRTTKKVTIVAVGSRPSWSPDSTKLAYATESGVTIQTLADGKKVTIKDTKPQLNAEFGVAFPPRMIGWKSNTELLFDLQYNPNDVKFNIGNAQTGANTELTVAGLQAEESMRAAILSNDASRLLIEIDKDPGYDTAVINVDGTGLAKVSGNDAARWAGSGYKVAAFAPDSKSVLLHNNFIKANPAQSERATGELEAHGFNGATIFTVSDYVLNNDTWPCWYNTKTIYGIFREGDSGLSLNAYDIDAKTVKKLANVDVGEGLMMSCAK